MTKKKGKKTSTVENLILSQNVALIAAEEFALSMVPLLLAVNEVGGVAAAIRILKANKKISGRDPR